jgi:hypothetical protein
MQNDYLSLLAFSASKAAAARHHHSISLHALTLLEHTLTISARNAADLLPKPLKLTKRLVSGDVVSVIRKSRDADKIWLSN